jgi:hypothetical protein
MSMVSVNDLRAAKQLSTANWDSLSPEDRRYTHSLLGSMYHYYDDLATYTSLANGRIERLCEALHMAIDGKPRWRDEARAALTSLGKEGGL